jgi:hypothetical protein
MNHKQGEKMWIEVKEKFGPSAPNFSVIRGNIDADDTGDDDCIVYGTPQRTLKMQLTR